MADVWAAIAAELPLLVVPEIIPGGNPVIDVPDESPTSPLITDEPVLVMVDPAIMA